MAFAPTVTSIKKGTGESVTACKVGMIDTQVRVGTQPRPFPLLPKGPDTTPKGYPCGCSPWVDKN